MQEWTMESKLRELGRALKERLQFQAGLGDASAQDKEQPQSGVAVVQDLPNSSGSSGSSAATTAPRTSGVTLCPDSASASWAWEGGEEEQEPVEPEAPAPAACATPSRIPVIPADELRLLRLVSTSPFGEVYAAEWRGSRVAVKCLGPLLASAGRPFGDEPSRRAFLASAAPLAMLDHPNLAKARGVVLDGGSSANSGSPDGSTLPLHPPALVLDWVEGGSLWDTLAAHDPPLLRSGAACLELLRQVAAGMAHLHGHGLVAFALSPRSVLLGSTDDELAVRVSGYELPSPTLSALQDPVVAFCPEVLPWLAPELHIGTAPVTEKVDVYSFAIMMWQLWARAAPYDVIRLMILGDAHRGSGVVMRPILPNRGAGGKLEPARGWRALMERCWAEDPTARPSFEEIGRELAAMAEEG